jgi:probable phosphoglycerate mutase
MTKILLIRHGHVEGIKPERFRGRAALELTDQGRAEAAAVANRIAGRWQPRRIYTSPLSRCVKTAEAVAEACAVAAQICDDLTDTDYGVWQFKTFHQAKAENPSLFAAWFATPHLVCFLEGESLQDVAARTANALRFVLACHNDETIVLVAHDSVNRVMLLQFLGLPLALLVHRARSLLCERDRYRKGLGPRAAPQRDTSSGDDNGAWCELICKRCQGWHRQALTRTSKSRDFIFRLRLRVASRRSPRRSSRYGHSDASPSPIENSQRATMQTP